MKTRNLTLLSLLIFLVTSCMPDSFTKFKEEPPKKTSSSGGSTDGDPTDPAATPVPEVSDVVFSISSFEVLQASGDTVFFAVSDSSDFRVGDSVNVSEVAIGPGTTDVGIITSINSVALGDDYLTIALSGTGIVGPNNYLKKDFFIDTCLAGYNSCAVGSVPAAIITSVVSFFVTSEAPSVIGALNFNKALSILGTSDFGFSPANLAFDYTLNPTTPIGFGFRNTANAIQTDDALISPFGPFTSSITMDFNEESPITVTASVASAQFGTVLDPEESASAVFYMGSKVPGEPVESSETFNLTYLMNNGNRFIFEVANASGFNVGEQIFSCRFNIPASCDQVTDEIQGTATIDYIDRANGVIFASALDFDHDANGGTPDRLSHFPDGNFVTNGTVITLQDGDPANLYRHNEAGTTILPNWNVQNDITDDPTGISYEISNVFVGLSFNPLTGAITITNPDKVIHQDITVTAKNTTTSEIIDTYKLVMTAFGTASAISFANTTTFDSLGITNTQMQASINQSDSAAFKVTSFIGSFPSGSELADNTGISKIYYQVTGALPTGTTLFNPAKGSTVGTVDFSPTTYLDGLTTYTVSGFHPAYDPVNPFASITFTFKSATTFNEIHFPQSTGDSLIIEVSDTSVFSSTPGSNSISTNGGATGTIQLIDTDNKLLYVTVGSNLTGRQVFKEDDEVDLTPSFVLSRGQILDVVHVYDEGDLNNRFTTANGLVPALYDQNGAVISLAPGEVVDWLISPTIPSDMTFSATTGEMNSIADNSLGTLENTKFSIFSVNEIGRLVQVDYKMLIKQSPSFANVSRYQFVRLDNNGNRFYRGTRFSTSGGDSKKGKVLLTIDIDGNGINDGLLVENNGDIVDGAGIDNTPSFFASEGLVVPYHFWYVKDTTGIIIGNTITSSSGATATVEAVDSVNHRIYVKVVSGTFVVGNSISNGGGANTQINSIENRSYVTGLIQVNNLAALNQFTVGGVVTSDTSGNNLGDSLGIVVQKHIDNNGTAGAGDDRHYLLIQHISGDFSEGDNLDNASPYVANVGNIRRIVGPNITLDISAGVVPANSSSSGRVDSNGNPFFEGSMIGNFQSSTPTNQYSIGYAVAGTDYSTGKITVNVESFGIDQHFFKDNGINNTFIDDFTESAVGAIAAQAHNKVTNVTLNNLVIGYAGDELHLEPSLKGEFSSVTISPSLLPDGLTFDNTTGVLSGVPSEQTAKNDYTFKFISSDGLSSVSYVLPIVIYNQFEVFQETPLASSQYIHKEGQGMAATSCKVISPQVIDDVNDPNYNQAIYGLNDLVCRLESGEQDLFNQGIELKAKFGPGMCEFVQIEPFGYDSHMRANTAREVVVYEAFNDANKCAVADNPNFFLLGTGAPFVTAGAFSSDRARAVASGDDFNFSFGETYCFGGDCVQGELSTADICTYDYTNGPNVDEGQIVVNTVSCSYLEDDQDADANDVPDRNTCRCTNTRSTVDCSGEILNARAGARKSILEKNESSLITATFNGGTADYSFSSPIGLDQSSNHYLANYIASREYASAPAAANSCHASDFHMDSYSAVGTLSTNRTSWANYGTSNDPLGNSSLGNYYTVNCLDAASNIKARVRVQVRDWNREFTPETAEIEQLNATTLVDDASFNCFGDFCDGRFDFDSIWKDLATNSGAVAADMPRFDSCGDTSEYEITPAQTLTFDALSRTATVVGAALGSTDLVRGNVIYIESDNANSPGLDSDDIPMLVESVSGSTITFAHLPGFNGTSVPFYIVRKLPFPLTGHEE